MLSRPVFDTLAVTVRYIVGCRFSLTFFFFLNNTMNNLGPVYMKTVFF